MKVRPPSVRGSSKQDAAAATAEVAVRIRPPRSIVKALRVDPVESTVIRPLIEGRHYLHSMPAVVTACYGVFVDGALVGAVTFSAGARQGHRVLDGARSEHVTTLTRFWMSDDVPPNGESRVLGVVLRDLARAARYKLVLTYADPAAGHVGTIYQASGWAYLGQGNQASYLDLGDGVARHPRSVYEQVGSNAVRHLRATGIPARRVAVEGKHRYAYVLDPSWRWRLRGRAKCYPKTPPRGPPENGGRREMRPAANGHSPQAQRETQEVSPCRP